MAVADRRKRERAARREAILKAAKRGPLKGRICKLPNVNDDEIEGASRYLAIDGGSMIYSPVLKVSSRPMR